MTRSFWAAGAILLSAVGGAGAADLPTAKPAPAVPKTASCFASFYDWFSASATDCPLSYAGITVYGQIDGGFGYSSHAAEFNRYYNNGVAAVIAKMSRGPQVQLVPNGLSQSNIGIKGREEFAPGWAFVFDANAGFDPYTLTLSNGPRSLVQNNALPIQLQEFNSDSSRAGQWDNTRGYVGVSNSTFGTLTVGRQYSFSADAVSAYDPMGGAYAFSLIGSSSTYVSGLGDTEVARYNTSLKYQVAYNNVRAGAVWQFGGYDQGNGSDGAYQFDAGFDYAGFSFDAIYSYARDAVSLATYSVDPLPKGVTQDDLKATLADIRGLLAVGKYTWGQWKFYGGYENALFMPPSETYPDGFGSLGGYTVLPGAVTATAYNIHKVLQVGWVGAKYAVRPDLDISAAYYIGDQNDYTNYSVKGTAPCGPNTTVPAPGYSPQGANHSTCAGTIQAVSGLVDWRPYQRLDVYAGIMYSEVTGGLANGFLHSNNIAPTAGLRLTF
jgi:predicted porin